MMTGFIITSIIMSWTLVSLTTVQVANLADQRCPCTVAAECEMKFAETDPEAILAVQQFIPACPPFQGRCCTAETMLITIIDLVQQRPNLLQLQKQPTYSQSLQNNLVSCVPVDQCPPGNIYGTNPKHFEEYGIISSEEADCFAGEEKVLCINQERSSVSESAPFHELPCVQPSSCSEIYSEVSHIAEYGLQFSCNSNTEVRCVTTFSPTSLPCIQTALCSEVYGTLASHFTQYGVQNSCATSEEVRCVVPLQVTITTSRPIQIITQAPGISGTTSSLVIVELPCVPDSLCLDKYGTQESHVSTYGIQAPCSSPDSVKCISYEVLTASASKPSTTTTRRSTQTATIGSAVYPTQASIIDELPCVSASLCHEKYGSQESHLSTYGVQVPCQPGLVRCVSYAVLTGLTSSTTSVYYGSTKGYATTIGYTDPKPHKTHPLFTTQAPLTAPAPSVVNIIGPRPVYLSFGNHGLSSHHDGGSKQNLISELLKLLDRRLKQVVKRIPTDHAPHEQYSHLPSDHTPHEHYCSSKDEENCQVTYEEECFYEEQVCPYITQPGPEECEDRTNECWSPGVADTDCPGSALCCSDGCANVCQNRIKTCKKVPKKTCHHISKRNC